MSPAAITSTREAKASIGGQGVVRRAPKEGSPDGSPLLPLPPLPSWPFFPPPLPSLSFFPDDFGPGVSFSGAPSTSGGSSGVLDKTSSSSKLAGVLGGLECKRSYCIYIFSYSNFHSALNIVVSFNHETDGIPISHPSCSPYTMR